MFINARLGTGGTSFPQKNRVPETVEGRPCPDNVSTTGVGAQTAETGSGGNVRSPGAI